MLGLAIRGAGIAIKGVGKALKRQKDFQKKMKKKHPTLKTKNIAGMVGAGVAASYGAGKAVDPGGSLKQGRRGK